MSEINIDENNGMGQVEINLIPPGIGPPGAYNTSIVPRYSFNLTATQDLASGGYGESYNELYKL